MPSTIYAPVLNQRRPPYAPAQLGQQDRPQPSASAANTQGALPSEGGFQPPTIPFVERRSNETDLSHSMYAPILSPPTSRPAGQEMPPLVARVDPMHQTTLQVHRPPTTPAIPNLYDTPSSGFTKTPSLGGPKSLFTPPSTKSLTPAPASRPTQEPAQLKMPEQPEFTPRGVNERFGGVGGFNRKVRRNAMPTVRNVLEPIASGTTVM